MFCAVAARFGGAAADPCRSVEAAAAVHLCPRLSGRPRCQGAVRLAVKRRHLAAVLLMCVSRGRRRVARRSLPARLHAKLRLNRSRLARKGHKWRRLLARGRVELRLADRRAAAATEWS